MAIQDGRNFVPFHAGSTRGWKRHFVTNADQFFNPEDFLTLRANARLNPRMSRRQAIAVAAAAAATPYCFPQRANATGPVGLFFAGVAEHVAADAARWMLKECFWPYIKKDAEEILTNVGAFANSTVNDVLAVLKAFMKKFIDLVKRSLDTALEYGEQLRRRVAKYLGVNPDAGHLRYIDNILYPDEKVEFTSEKTGDTIMNPITIPYDTFDGHRFGVRAGIDKIFLPWDTNAPENVRIQKEGKPMIPSSERATGDQRDAFKGALNRFNQSKTLTRLNHEYTQRGDKQIAMNEIEYARVLNAKGGAKYTGFGIRKGEAFDFLIVAPVDVTGNE